MKRVWNAFDNDWEYIADEEAEESTPVTPVSFGDSAEEIKSRVAEIMERGEAMSQQERNRRYRQSHPEKYSQYRLDYMRKYRAKGE